MPTTAKQPASRWDIFCNVIDNYGDIGVCWRLARQLVAEHGIAVRLWVDALDAFHTLCPTIDPALVTQVAEGVEVRAWHSPFPEAVPGEVVIEAFACQLPESFVQAMSERPQPPAWINLDYLSGEAWVAGCHTLPSPHPRLPLTKYFFFPGFDGQTGGLLRESDLSDQRAVFAASAEQQTALWHILGGEAPAADALRVSLFAYENQAIADLLETWANGEKPVCCLAPATRTRPALEAWAAQTLPAGSIVRRGQLELRAIPFVSQPDYDRLLWSCDLNFVRGEDSFVRAQWAARPMIWQIYPQDDDAHRVKLAAFVDRYVAGLPETEAALLRSTFTDWNDCHNTGRFSTHWWSRYLSALPALRVHAALWQKNLQKQEDLCSNLVRFCRSKL